MNANPVTKEKEEICFYMQVILLPELRNHLCHGGMVSVNDVLVFTTDKCLS
jgi:hypothetical protein